MKLRDKKSIEGARGHIIGSSNQSAFPEDKKSDRPIRLLWQDKEVGRTNQSSSYGPSSVSNQSGLFLRTIFCIDQSDPLDGSSYGPSSVLTNQILSDRSSYGPSFRLDQSDPSDRSSYGTSSVSTNQIIRTDFPTDHLSVSSNQILRTDFPTDHLSVSSNQILWTDLPTDHFSVSSNQILRTDLPTDNLPSRPIRSLGR